MRFITLTNYQALQADKELLYERTQYFNIICEIFKNTIKKKKYDDEYYLTFFLNNRYYSITNIQIQEYEDHYFVFLFSVRSINYFILLDNGFSDFYYLYEYLLHFIQYELDNA